MHFSTVFFASAILKLAHSTVIGSRSLAGEATFYGGNVAGGACSFSTYTLPSGIFGTALSDSNWDTSGNCGACVAVTASGKTITAMIVDECPGCGTNHLDLFPDAFSTLADPSKGVIDITWDYIDCPITSPLIVHNKDGVSAYWFSMQVVNANKGVKSLEVSTDGGSTWQATARQDYNFFENSMGFGTTTVDVKVTSADGDIVIVKSVTVSSGSSTTASSNFGSSGTVPSSEAQVESSAPPKTEVVEASTPVSIPISETTEFPISTTPITIPGANFEETSAAATTPTFSAPITSYAVSGIVEPSATAPVDTTLKTTVTLSKTTTKKKCSSITPTATAAPVIPTSLAGGIVNSTITTPYSITSVGTSSSIAGGNAAGSTTSSTPFTGSAAQSVAKIGSLVAALGFSALLTL